MNILFLDWPCFCREDILQFFQNRGDSVSLFHHPEYHLRKSSSFSEAASFTLESNHYDFCFSYNFFPLMSTACFRHNTKYVAFVYDSPQVKLYSYTVTYPTNYIFLFDSYLVNKFRTEGLLAFYYMPLPVNADRIHTLLQMPYDYTRLSADISFVGSLYNESHTLYDSVSSIPEYARGYLDAIMQAQSHVYGYSFLEECLTPFIIESMQSSVHYQKNPDGVEPLSYIFSNYYLCRKLTSMERIRLLTQAAALFPLKLFTANESFFIPNAVNMGTSDYQTETPYIFHNSKINLNITLRSIPSGIPLRCMEILSCGGFLLTNYQADFLRHFIPGKDFVYFDGENDMLQKIDYYLKHETERCEIADSGYDKVLRYHSFEIIFEQIFNIIFE